MVERTAPTLPLRVFVVWHPGFLRGQGLAEALYRHLCHDPDQPASRALRVPVRFRSQASAGLPPGPAVPAAGLPAGVELDGARTVVVVLVDDAMVADPAWGAYVAGIQTQCLAAGTPSGGYPQHRLVPVSLCANAFKLNPEIADVNFLRLHTLPEAQQTQALLNGVTHELARLLLNRPQVGDEQQMRAAGPAPVRVFLSHAKHGGLDLTDSVRDYIARRTQLETFFDVHDIPTGSGWRKVLREAAAGEGVNALLVLQTDAYSSREWCRIEAMQAKLGWVPMVVVQAIEHAELRGFPYLGNVPTVRWPAAGLSEYLTELVSRLATLRSIDDAEASRLGGTVVDAIESEISESIKELKQLRRSIAERVATFGGRVQSVDPLRCQQFQQLMGPAPESSDAWGQVIGTLLYEVLRAAYFPLWVEYAAALHNVRQPLRALSYPPELLTLLAMQRHVKEQPGTVFVYPEPPLGTEEVEMLCEAAPDLRFVTPIRLPLLKHEE